MTATKLSDKLWNTSQVADNLGVQRGKVKWTAIGLGITLKTHPTRTGNFLNIEDITLLAERFGKVVDTEGLERISK